MQDAIRVAVAVPRHTLGDRIARMDVVTGQGLARTLAADNENFECLSAVQAGRVTGHRPAPHLGWLEEPWKQKAGGANRRPQSIYVFDL